MDRVHGALTGDNCKHCGEPRIWMRRKKDESTGFVARCVPCARKASCKSVKKRYAADANYRESEKSRVYAEQLAAKAWAVALLGGKCQDCGYSKTQAVLQFHHTQPELKTMKMSGNYLRFTNTEVICKELLTCDLLCSNCHQERHHYNDLKGERRGQDY